MEKCVAPGLDKIWVVLYLGFFIVRYHCESTFIVDCHGI